MNDFQIRSTLVHYLKAHPELIEQYIEVEQQKKKSENVNTFF